MSILFCYQCLNYFGFLSGTHQNDDALVWWWCLDKTLPPDIVAKEMAENLLDVLEQFTAIQETLANPN
jgi:hypothetical protein